jgi:hypothetical protein
MGAALGLQAQQCGAGACLFVSQPSSLLFSSPAPSVAILVLFPPALTITARLHSFLCTTLVYLDTLLYFRAFPSFLASMSHPSSGRPLIIRRARAPFLTSSCPSRVPFLYPCPRAHAPSFPSPPFISTSFLLLFLPSLTLPCLFFPLSPAQLYLFSHYRHT